MGKTITSIVSSVIYENTEMKEELVKRAGKIVKKHEAQLLRGLYKV